MFVLSQHTGSQQNCNNRNSDGHSESRSSAPMDRMGSSSYHGNANNNNNSNGGANGSSHSNHSNHQSSHSHQNHMSPYCSDNGIKSDSPSRKRRRVSLMPSQSPPAIWEQRQSPRGQQVIKSGMFCFGLFLGRCADYDCLCSDLTGISLDSSYIIELTYCTSTSKILLVFNTFFKHRYCICKFYRAGQKLESSYISL